MSDTVISVENLSKRYLVAHNPENQGHRRYLALRDVIGREISYLARKGRDLLRGRQVRQADKVEEFWALKDVSFEVPQGEVLGIIGRNGAGKSTLLKILSRITDPTKGRVTLRGRVASLLEVGTGFHPELTGRENIYLNGAILGMSRAEIRKKFDEIVGFAEVEKFLDTPVKRYSSGMYVRLAFAVAAHLEPEILIVDEVLAVGDVEFQKKCLGKMNEVSRREGRTVLFVSHNLAAVESLCRWCIVLRNGKIFKTGSPADVVSAYLGWRQTVNGVFDLSKVAEREGAGRVLFERITLTDERGKIVNRPKGGQALEIHLALSGTDRTRKAARCGLAVTTGPGATLFVCDCGDLEKAEVGSGDSLRLRIPTLPLSAGHYRLRLYLERQGIIEDWIQDGLEIEVADGDFSGSGLKPPMGWQGQTVLVPHVWDVGNFADQRAFLL